MAYSNWPVQFRHLLQSFVLISILTIVFLSFSEKASYSAPSLLSFWPSTTARKYAYATLLLPFETPENSTCELEDPNPYFTSTRLLNYQLLHSPKTRTTHQIPFLVLTTSDLPQFQKDQLTHESATLLEIEPITTGSNWLQPGSSRWKGVMAKLRLFQQTSYDLILFLDADTFLFHPLDSIFHDPSITHPQERKHTPFLSDISSSSLPLPETYIFATSPEALHVEHELPLKPWPYFNAGFFIFKPDLKIFDYLIEVLGVEGRFDSTYPEQNLLNYGFRKFGDMPWMELGGRGRWNVNLPNLEDVVGRGVRSVHAKLWEEGNLLETVPVEMREWWGLEKIEMERFYRRQGEGKGGG